MDLRIVDLVQETAVVEERLEARRNGLNCVQKRPGATSWYLIVAGSNGQEVRIGLTRDQFMALVNYR